MVLSGGKGGFGQNSLEIKYWPLFSRETDLEIQVQSEPFNNFPLNKADVIICIDSGNL